MTASEDGEYEPTRHIRGSYQLKSLQKMDSIEILENLNRYHLSKQDMVTGHDEQSTVPTRQDTEEES